MPWKERKTMSLREEFVVLACGEGVNMRELCERFGVSRKTGYKWVNRYVASGREGLRDRSRRPQRSPERTAAEIEQRVVELREAHPAWGGRKLRHRLLKLGCESVPAASTITEILRRHGRLNEEESAKHRAWSRFEHPQPNDLWQMDFKGHFALTSGRGRCHPLTVLDDHSRFALGLRACGDERHETVQEHLTDLFRRYGMPRRIVMDNGSPWGNGWDQRYTRLTVWMLRLGLGVTHGRPYHPQTQGKDERFHRTLTAELISRRSFRDLVDCQRQFDAWREEYNLIRPHEALKMGVPAERYRPSGRPFPEALPAIEYYAGDLIRKVHDQGLISYRRRLIHVGKAFCGLMVALRATEIEGVFDVYFCEECLGSLDVRETSPNDLCNLRAVRSGQRGSDNNDASRPRVEPSFATLTPAEPAVYQPFIPVLPMSPNECYP
jgi:transposase InsO family protein